MKLNVIISSQESLKKLLEIKLPIKIAYKVSKMISKLQPELLAYEESRTKLVKELGTEDKEKQTFTVNPENIANFQEELSKLLDINVEFAEGKVLEKIKIEDLGDILLEPSLLTQLDWLIE